MFLCNYLNLGIIGLLHQLVNIGNISMTHKKVPKGSVGLLFTLKQIKCILKNDLLRETIQKELSDESIDLNSFDNLSIDDLIKIHDVACDSLKNSWIYVKHFEAIFDEEIGEFSINIYGVRGCYYVIASEFDDVGPFDTIKEAESYIEFDYGGSLIKKPK